MKKLEEFLDTLNNLFDMEYPDKQPSVELRCNDQWSYHVCITISISKRSTKTLRLYTYYPGMYSDSKKDDNSEELAILHILNILMHPCDVLNVRDFLESGNDQDDVFMYNETKKINQ